MFILIKTDIFLITDIFICDFLLKKKSERLTLWRDFLMKIIMIHNKISIFLSIDNLQRLAFATLREKHGSQASRTLLQRIDNCMMQILSWRRWKSRMIVENDRTSLTANALINSSEKFPTKKLKNSIFNVNI